MSYEKTQLFSGTVDSSFGGTKKLLTHDIGYVTHGYLLVYSTYERTPESNFSTVASCALKIPQIYTLGRMSLAAPVFVLGVMQNESWSNMTPDEPQIGTSSVGKIVFDPTRTLDLYPVWNRNRFPVESNPQPAQLVVVLFAFKDTGVLAIN